MSDHRDTSRQGRPPARTPVKFPEIYTPAMPPLGLMEALGRWLAARRRRRALEQLLKLDGRLLRDIGVDRERIAQDLRRKTGPTSASNVDGEADHSRCA